MIKLSCDTTKLEKQLMELLNNLDKSSESIINEGCDLIKKQAKELCPVDTGELKKSIDKKCEHNTYKHDGYVFSPLEYALYVELGTRFMAPQPYLSPAFQINKEFFLEHLKETINKGGK